MVGALKAVDSRAIAFTVLGLRIAAVGTAIAALIAALALIGAANEAVSQLERQLGAADPATRAFLAAGGSPLMAQAEQARTIAQVAGLVLVVLGASFGLALWAAGDAFNIVVTSDELERKIARDLQVLAARSSTLDKARSASSAAAPAASIGATAGPVADGSSGATSTSSRQQGRDASTVMQTVLYRVAKPVQMYAGPEPVWETGLVEAGTYGEVQSEQGRVVQIRLLDGRAGWVARERLAPVEVFENGPLGAYRRWESLGSGPDPAAPEEPCQVLHEDHPWLLVRFARDGRVARIRRLEFTPT